MPILFSGNTLTDFSGQISVKLCLRIKLNPGLNKVSKSKTHSFHWACLHWLQDKTYCVTTENPQVTTEKLSLLVSWYTTKPGSKVEALSRHPPLLSGFLSLVYFLIRAALNWLYNLMS